MSSIPSKASAIWQGTIKGGRGTISADSQAFEKLPYTFGTRFEGRAGTNPEEMIAAAHAACFSMKLSGLLTEAGFPPSKITTEAEVTMTVSDSSAKMTQSFLTMEATVPGIDESLFQEIANEAKETCPVSLLLQPGLNDIRLSAKLNDSAGDSQHVIH